jgi:hypothetical protein
MPSHVKKTLVYIVAIGFFCFQSLSAFGQVPAQTAPEIMMQRPQPPMENVFFNVLWGSFTGGMLMMGWASLDDSKGTEERYSVDNLRTQFLTGATYGGLLGLIAGVYISFKGITFDENRTKIAILQPPRKDYFPTAKYSAQATKASAQDLSLFDFQYSF